MGSGKCAKVQCDFCALISPLHFREFVKPSLEKQWSLLDSSLYHLDGPDEIKHLYALMEIEDLKALQFTPGAGNPDGGSLLWYPIYDKAEKTPPYPVGFIGAESFCLLFSLLPATCLSPHRSSAGLPR